ncbi:uncharacterized protein EI97DRAFT_499138 [Westerdykella ornata]|uniref:Uncharacterized protein n=1 Tax=Westerdykella ornata TaxID=318751 RepID=A0A6A6JVJ6_WESOR|nr:uncharacterized protein EI97DRAFT_499138 [Westerdykella ornata]KAF2279766.1 hypothetical protein EI97DRAFT_499138 [Westerdykella ornata]
MISQGDWEVNRDDGPRHDEHHDVHIQGFHVPVDETYSLLPRGAWYPTADIVHEGPRDNQEVPNQVQRQLLQELSGAVQLQSPLPPLGNTGILGVAPPLSPTGTSLTPPRPRRSFVLPSPPDHRPVRESRIAKPARPDGSDKAARRRAYSKSIGLHTLRLLADATSSPRDCVDSDMQTLLGHATALVESKRRERRSVKVMLRARQRLLIDCVGTMLQPGPDSSQDQPDPVPSFDGLSLDEGSGEGV